LAADAQHVADNREVDILLVNTRELGGDHEGILGLVHINRRSPDTLHPTGLLSGATEEVVEETVHLGLHVTKITKGVDGLTKRAESDNRHTCLLLTGPSGPLI